MIKNGTELVFHTATQVAELMAAAARTAPKGNGIDNLEVRIVDGAEKDALAAEMRRIGKETAQDFYLRDGHNLDRAQVVVLFGTRISPIFCPNCGSCGYVDCDENIANDGICTFNTIDLGIAIGSAVSVASQHHIDNRVLMTAGRAALQLGYFPAEVRIAYAVPLSISSKNPFFDRSDKPEVGA